MPAWLLPAITGVLGAVGTIATNKANKKIARDQMDFQERMSSTAAQRSVEDYRKAGLNPALAYGQTASSPQGASTRVDDAAESGVSSGLRAREAMANLKIAQNQAKLLATQERAEVNRGEQAATQAGVNQATQMNLNQEYQFRQMQQPHDLRLAAARALFEENLIPGVRNQADFERKIGVMHPALKFLFNSGKSLTSMIQGVRK